METFVLKQLELLEIEREAEVEENQLLLECSSIKDLQKKGVCVPKLRFVNSASGLFGRSLNTFEAFWHGNLLSSHTMTSGDIVGIGVSTSDGKREIQAFGVITRANDNAITVALDKNFDNIEFDRDQQFMIIKLANDVTYRRIKRSLKNLHQSHNVSNSQMIDVLFDEKKPSSIDVSVMQSISFFNDNLNDTQKEAVKFVLSQKEVAIVHGPPGTGKTTTIVECILQTVAQKLKVLACAPSNVAVDNLVEKLSKHQVKMVRLGHPARFLPTIQQYSLDAVIANSHSSEVLDDLHKEIGQLKAKISKARGFSRKSLWNENKNLQKEMREREKSVMKEVLQNADVILATISSSSDDGPIKHLPKDHFNVCFIDECSQALEAACWIPLMFVRKCVLAGDHKQLPPTIISKKAGKDGLSFTLMERLLKIHGDQIKMMLTMQYRMHDSIMQWPSEQLYDNRLQAHESVKGHLLTDLPGIEDNDDTSIPLLLIDTAGCNLDELDIEDEESKGNEGEADLVQNHVENLIKSGINAKDIAVITPYNLQVDLIKSRLSGRYPKLEIKSVDGFQGREKEAVVLSLVRSNDKGEVGFLAEDRRINVAITRARRHLAVICNSGTVSYHNFLKSFVDYCSEKGEVRTASQYGENIGQQPSSVRVKQALAKSSSKSNKSGTKSDVQKKKAGGESMEKSKSYTTEEKRSACVKKYNDIISEFKESKETILPFPPTVNAFERMIIHEISEEAGLCHVSTGEGLTRCITISKTVQIQPELNKPSELSNDEKMEESLRNVFQSLKIEESLAEEKDGFQDSAIKDTFQHNPSQDSTAKDILQGRFINNTFQESPIKDTFKDSTKMTSAKKGASKKEPVSGKKDTYVKRKHEKPKLKVLKLKDDCGDEDNFDALIEQVMKADRTCSYEKCKKSVATLSQDCQFCKGRFCFGHFIPEVHGCGDAAKSHARAQIRKEGKIYPGSGKPQKKVDLVKQQYLHKKLDKRIEELSKQRKSKDKS